MRYIFIFISLLFSCNHSVSEKENEPSINESNVDICFIPCCKRVYCTGSYDETLKGLISQIEIDVPNPTKITIRFSKEMGVLDIFSDNQTPSIEKLSDYLKDLRYLNDTNCLCDSVHVLDIYIYNFSERNKIMALPFSLSDYQIRIE